MTVSTQDLIATIRRTMNQKYPGFMDFHSGEKVVLIMAYLADAIKVREQGTNRGQWVEAFLDCAGVAPGNPWCASSLTFACKVAGVACPPAGPAAVRNWQNWFGDIGRRVQTPERGDICLHNAGGGKGHIGVVVKVVKILGLTWIDSIEGNTGSGDAGSQRDGDGLYRRKRRPKFWSWGYGRLP